MAVTTCHPRPYQCWSGGQDHVTLKAHALSIRVDPG
jgi:hypothetical protein